MKRSDLTEKLLDIKRDKDWSWKYICEKIGGYSEVLIVGAILGQMKLTKPQAANAGELFGLSKSEVAMLNETPMRGEGTPMPPTDPPDLPLLRNGDGNGPAWKALIEEEFGTASCRRSISTWHGTRRPIPRATASRSRCRANSCRTILRRQRQRAGSMIQGRVKIRHAVALRGAQCARTSG
jgi:cyanate lyase